MKRKRTISDYIERKKISCKNNKIKSMIEFVKDQSNIINYLAVEVKTTLAVTTNV